MSKPPCPDCDFTHAGDDAQAIGIFQSGGPFAYVANHEGEPIYATRQEAIQSVCVQRRIGQ